MDLADLMESRELAELSNDVPIEKLASPNDLRTRKFSNDEDLDSWDALYNETGDLLRPEALEEVTPSPFKINGSLFTFKFNHFIPFFLNSSP